MMPPASEICAIADRNATPFYLYDMALLRHTLDEISRQASVNHKFHVNYAMKACAEAEILRTIKDRDFGADTVSGGEIELALKAGFAPGKIMFAGVGKTDAEIDLALRAGIGCFNVESFEELDVISQRAVAAGKKARIALRLNPDIDAHTHHYITTGLAENKFGINMHHADRAVRKALHLPGIEFRGFHFHIGSQITVAEPFRILCERINALLEQMHRQGVAVRSVNVGGGLGVDYDNPDLRPVADFGEYFGLFNRHLDTSRLEEVHFELGRAVVAQCGSLITRVVYVKKGDTRTFVIVDAGMNDLIRPALYGARHAIQNLSGLLRGDSPLRCDVVGPVCESSDCFGTDYDLAGARRGDILAVRSAGAYGQSMASRYNARPLANSIFIR